MFKEGRSYLEHLGVPLITACMSLSPVITNLTLWDLTIRSSQIAWKFLNRHYLQSTLPKVVLIFSTGF